MIALPGARVLPLAALLLAAVTADVRADISVIDDSGANVVLARPAQRIVSLAPHLTEQLYAIGAGERIVGTTEHADYPPSARAIPRVARAHAISVEGIAALQPDLIVTWGSGFPAETVEPLRRLGVPVFVNEPRTLANVASSMRRLGVLTGLDGGPAAARFSARLDELRAAHAAQPPVRVFYQVWAEPLMTLTSRHVISEAIKLCGGRNVFADVPGISPTVSAEAVIAADPQLIATAEPGARAGGALDYWKRFDTLSATRLDQFATLDADRINRQGPRLPDEIAVLCAAIARTRARLTK